MCSVTLGLAFCETAEAIPKAVKALDHRCAGPPRSEPNGTTIDRMSVELRNVDVKMDDVEFRADRIFGTSSITVPPANAGEPAGTGQGSVLAALSRFLDAALQPTVDLLWQAENAVLEIGGHKLDVSECHRTGPASVGDVVLAVAPNGGLKPDGDFFHRYPRGSFSKRASSYVGGRYLLGSTPVSVHVAGHAVVAPSHVAPLYAVTLSDGGGVLPTFPLVQPSTTQLNFRDDDDDDDDRDPPERKRTKHLREVVLTSADIDDPMTLGDPWSPASPDDRVAVSPRSPSGDDVLVIEARPLPHEPVETTCLRSLVAACTIQ